MEGFQKTISCRCKMMKECGNVRGQKHFKILDNVRHETNIRFKAQCRHNVAMRIETREAENLPELFRI